MAVGQAVLSSSLDVGALRAAEGRIERLALDRGAAHGQRLRAVLDLQRVLRAAGAGVAASANIALLEQVSEQAAAALLAQAELLASLPGGLEAVDCGLLTVEQAGVVSRRLSPLDRLVQLRVWELLQARLLAAFEAGAVLSPSRVGDLLARWTIQVDPDGAVARRKDAEALGSVDYRRRDDGLADIFLLGVPGPVAQAVLCRIRDRSAPWGAGDDRLLGKRRLDAATALLRGQDQLPLDDEQNPFNSPAEVSRCGPVCGCRNGEPVPCGIGVTLLIPLGAALGTTDEVALLEGHGPLEPDLAQAILHNAPVIRPVWVDEHGTPVAIGDRTERPPRQDAAGVREALLRLAAAPPGAAQPRYPDDHPPDSDPPDTDSPGDHPLGDHPPGVRRLDRQSPDDRSPGEQSPDDCPSGSHPPVDHLTDDCSLLDGWSAPRTADDAMLAAATEHAGASATLPVLPTVSAPLDADAGLAAASLLGTLATDIAAQPRGSRLWRRSSNRRPQLVTHPHPVDTPGPYRVPARLARLLRVRAPRCEWPGCGHWAVGCDLDHDLAHPAGATCGCNVGPLCRRHHRLKQLLMSKVRHADGVSWTGPTGRTWLSPSQHDAPLPPVRPLPALADLRGPGDPYLDEDGSTDLDWLSGKADRLRADDPFDTETEPREPDRDPYEAIARQRWGIALDDHTSWTA